MGTLDGQVALVTGAASGLGRACAARFGDEGAAVVYADYDEAGAQAAADEAVARGQRASAERLDVTDAEQCRRAVAATVERHGRLDIVLTSAGVGDSAPIGELDEATWRRTIDVNLTGTLLTIQAAFPALAKQGGSVITLGSVAGLIASAGFGPYGASKAGVVHLTRILALEGAPQGIRVNAICPSWIWTPMVRKAFDRLLPGAPDAVVQGYLTKQSPLGRMGTPEDIAKAALFLASDQSAFITGQALAVDGGLTLGPVVGQG